MTKGKLRENIDTHMHTGGLRVIAVDIKTIASTHPKCLPTTECGLCQGSRLSKLQTIRIVT